MVVLAFFLECAALVALVGSALSLLVWPGLVALSSRRRTGAPAVRAEIALGLGSLPAVGALAALASASLPPLRSLLSGTPDHCTGHSHHQHLCFLHATGLHPALAALGSAALAILLFRAGALAGRAWSGSARLRALERLGRTTASGRFRVILVPGSPWLCHAAGPLHPRVLVSASLAERLEPRELEAALAHERAHLERRDPLARTALAVAGIFALPWVGRAAISAYASASEDACDAAARLELGDGAIVAGALVKVASLQRGALSTALAFGEHDLERRVRALLDGSLPARVWSFALWPAGILALCVAVASVAEASALHHAIETLLFLLA